MFEGTFEMFDVKVRRLRNGDKLSLVLESTENLETEKALIEYRGEMVKVQITSEVKEDQPHKPKDQYMLEGNFEVYEVKCRRLKNGNKLRLVLEELYEKQHELTAVKQRFDVIQLMMEKAPAPEPELFEEEKEI